MSNFSDRLNKNIEATKKKIPSMGISELINTWLSGYHPECLSLALGKISEDVDKYPKIAKLFHELQDELTKLSKVNKNFDSKLHEDQYLESAYSFIDSIINRLNKDYKNDGLEIYNQHDGRFNGSIVFRKSISHTSNDPKHGKVTYYDYIKFISIDYHISSDGFINFVINKINNSQTKELGKLKLNIDDVISESDYRKLTDIVSKEVKMNKNFNDRVKKCFGDTEVKSHE